MCTDAAENIELIARAYATSRVLLERCYGVRVAKALDISTAKGFDAAVATMAAMLRGKTKEEEAAAVRAALRELNVDFSKTDAEMRRRLVNGAMEAAGRHLALIPKSIEHTLDVTATDVIDATRADVRGRGATIGVKWNAVDKRIAEHLVSRTGNYVTDSSGKRNEAFGAEAKKIIDAGVAKGLGREEMARQLEVAARGQLEDRSRFYWETVAASFIGDGRSFSQISGYAEAGIERYEILAVLDEVTTNICRFLNGKTFSVADGLAAFEEQAAISDPAEIKKVAPWARERSGLLYVNHRDGRQLVARVDASAVGRSDEIGTFSSGKGEKDLVKMGLTFPPYHGLCRSTTVPSSEPGPQKPKPPRKPRAPKPPPPPPPAPAPIPVAPPAPPAPLPPPPAAKLPPSFDNGMSVAETSVAERRAFYEAMAAEFKRRVDEELRNPTRPMASRQDPAKVAPGSIPHVKAVEAVLAKMHAAAGGDSHAALGDAILPEGSKFKLDGREVKQGNPRWAIETLGKIFSRNAMDGIEVKRSFFKNVAFEHVADRAHFRADAARIVSVAGDKTQARKGDQLSYVRVRALDRRVVAHEFAHWYEHVIPMFTKLSAELRDERATSKTEESLRTMTGNFGFDPGEKALPDKFVNPYVGKVYRSTSTGFDYATEVLSMGVERFHEPSEVAKFLGDDPEHFGYTLAVLLGKIRL